MGIDVRDENSFKTLAKEVEWQDGKLKSLIFDWLWSGAWKSNV